MSNDHNMRRGMNPEDPEGFQDDADQLYEDYEDANDPDPDEENWETYDSEFAEEGEPGESGKKKLSTFNMMLIGGAVAVGLVIFGLNFMGGKTQKAPKQAVQQTAAKKEQKNDQYDPNAPTVPALSPTLEDKASASDSLPKGGLLNDAKQLDGLANSIASGQDKVQHATESAAQPPMPAPMTSSASADKTTGKTETPLTPLPSETASSRQITPEANAVPPGGDGLAVPANAPNSAFLKADGKDPADAASLSDMPPQKNDSAPQPSQAVPPVQAEQSASAAQTPRPPGKADSTDNQNLAELNAKLDKLLNRVGALETKLANIPSQMNVQSLIHSIDEIDGRMARLENANASLPAEKSSGEPVKAAPVSMPADAEPSPSPRPVSRAVRKASQWVLKSAQPGQAYIAAPGREDMTVVQVGDNLPGIGRVTSIAMQNGRWVVSGTTGSVSQ